MHILSTLGFTVPVSRKSYLQAARNVLIICNNLSDCGLEPYWRVTVHQNRPRRSKRHEAERRDVYQQVRAIEIPQIEVDTGPTSDDFIFRLLVLSRTGERIALELTFEHFRGLMDAAGTTQKLFPGGRLAN